MEVETIKSNVGMSFKIYQLKDICVIHGGNPSPKESEFSNSGIPFVKMKDLGVYHHSSALVETENKVDDTLIKLKRLKIIPKGCILLPRSGSVAQNHRAILAQDSVIVSHICALEIIDKGTIFNKYLYYYLTTIDMVKITKKTTGLDAITFEDLGKITIPLPPLATQKRIAEILDAADALRRKDQKLLKKYDELAQAIFIDMFGDPVKNEKGWQVKSLENITTKLGDGLHGTPSYSTAGDYYFINGNNLEDGAISVNETTKKVDENEFLKHKKDLNENTMLVSINGTIGKVAFYRGEKIILGKSACYFNIDKMQVAPIYLYSLIKSNYFINYAGGNATGSTIKNVSLKTMREFPVPLPPIEKQMIYDDLITLVWESIKVVNRNDKQELFNSLIQKAFKGELVFHS
jgi:type I restriction enzyme S subunit